MSAHPTRREFTDVLSTPENLSPIVAETGGGIMRVADAGNGLRVPRVVPMRRADNFAGDGWIGFRTSDASVLKGIDRYPLFAGLLGLALLLGAVTAMWYRESR